jgi:hypothetical protein
LISLKLRIKDELFEKMMSLMGCCDCVRSPSTELLQKSAIGILQKDVFGLFYIFI